MKKTNIALAIAAFCLSPSLANAANHFNPADIYHGSGVTLFKNFKEVDEHTGFRIPAIAAGNGFVIAASDVRYHGGQVDLATSANQLHKTKIGTKISYDGGVTWTDLAVHDAQQVTDENDFMSMATDPAVLVDSKTNNILMFGLRTNIHVGNGTVCTDAHGDLSNLQPGETADFIMFTSKDQGQSWETKNIKNEVLGQINAKGGTTPYTLVFQGPGGGMSYNGKIYVPIQAWATNKTTGGKGYFSSSGFMVSEDGGESWKVSSMLIPNVDDKLANKTDMQITSESSIFYHKGKIRIAVKNEGSITDKYDKRRLCFEYDESTDSWTKVEESFIPKEASKAETSSHSLSEDVYLAAYSVNAKHDRQDPMLATNTGIKIQLNTGRTLGYTSITSDDSNIYVLYESTSVFQNVPDADFSQSFKAIDWKHRDYANLNTQIRNRATEVNRIADVFAAEKGSISGSFGSDKINGQLIGSAGGLKGGIFITQNDEVDKDDSAVVEYDNFEVSLVAGLDQQFSKNIKGNVMLGYMNSDIEYANGAENDVQSIMGSYRLQFDTDVVGIRSGISAVCSRNDFKRNNKEGLGKTAQFDSYSVSLSNEVFKNFDMREFGSLELSGGMINTFFSHEDFREKGGEGIGENGQLGANNATIRASGLQSHEVFVEAGWTSEPLALCDYAHVTFNGDMKYAIDLANSDDWFEEYRSMSVERKYDSIGELYAARDGGLFTASLGADLEILKQIKVGIKGVADSRGEFSANLMGKISL